MSSDIIRLAPFRYIHVQDKNSNVTRLEVGPQTFIKQENENIVSGGAPLYHVVMPPYHFCTVTDPV
jgi:major vault protein